jgi:hypothetical protein
MDATYWLPVPCIVLHAGEEFAWPGGFIEWHRGYRPEITASITVRFVVVVNALLLLLAVLLAVYGPGSARGISAWLSLMSALACNAFFHVRGSLVTRRYSPGIITGLLLYVPLCCWGYWHFVAGGFPPQKALVAFAIGALYQFWSASAHRRRAGAS